MLGRIFIGRYEVNRLLGEGGMGRVFLARNIHDGRQVVVKVMHEHIASDTKFRDRFARETELMKHFRHPHTVTFLDAKLDDPLGPCIVMEYIKGINLDKLLERNRRFTPARVGRLIGQLCEVLQSAHDTGIIHRDLKPSNLMMIDPDSPKESVKVMDFGLAKLIESETLKKVTDTNVEFAVGTPGYICPEQVRGEEMDHRGDLYSVGVIIYELLTGRLPFPGPSSMDMLLAHATETPPTFAELQLESNIPPAIEALVFACLEKNPEQRPQSARELAEMFDTALDQDEVVTFKSQRPEWLNRTQGEATDPTTLAFEMEAWLPESIAIVKLRGFVHDAGGEVIESIPGVIRVRLGGRGTTYRSSGTGFSWLGFGNRRHGPIDVELHLHKGNHRQENKLTIHVVFRPANPHLLRDALWQDRCTQIYIDVRGYLMGQ